MSKDVFIYRIDSTDTIISVSENWLVFAEANAWSGHLRPENVLGHRLWDFIQGFETQHLYEELFRRVRGGMSSQAIPFRCDSPSERRFLELRIEKLADEQIEITSKILRTEPHSAISLLSADTSRSMAFVTICSMCKKIKVSPRQWAEIEEALIELRLFQADEMPQLTHGICPSCYQEAIAKLDAF